MNPPTEKKEIRFDYDRQCWIENGIVQRCGHPDPINCRCYGKVHEGEKV